MRNAAIGDTWGLIATGTCLVGALVIVVQDKALRYLADLLQGAGTMYQQAFLRERAMKAFDVWVLVWTMRRDQRPVALPHLTESALVLKGNRVRPDGLPTKRGSLSKVS